MTQTKRRRPRWPLVAFLAGVLAIAAWQWISAGHSAPPAPRVESRLALEIQVQAEQQAVAGASISVAAGNSWRRLAVSDAAGRVQFRDCPRTRLQVVAEAHGYVRDTRTFDVSSTPAVLRIDLIEGSALSGRVHDESDRPVPDAVVLARIIGGASLATQEPWSARSGADGSFSFDTLPPARVTLEISDGGHHEAAIVAEIRLPSDEPVDVLLRRTARLAGRVVDAAHKPSAKVRVTLAGSGVWPARISQTDSTGDFTFDGVPEGIYEVRAELNDAISAPLEGIAIGPGNEARVELMLLPAAVLHGVVRDIASGRALAGADVEVVEEALSAAPKRTRSAADGGFRVEPLRAVAQRVTVRVPGYVTSQTWVTPGGAAFSVELLRAVSVSGNVQDDDGRPVANADLEVTGRSETGYAVHMLGPINEPPSAASADGAQGAAAGPSNLGVTHGGVPRIPLGATANSGEPAGNAAGSLLGDPGFRSDAQGNFRLEGLPPGALVLAAHKLGFGPGHSRTLVARPGAALEDVSIVLPRGAALTGRVLDSHREPVAHVRVDLNAADATRSTVTAEDGTFRFDAVRGACTVQARAVGAPIARVEVSAQDVGHREIEVVLESATDRVFGRVLDSRERPIESASVHLETGRGRTFSASALSGRDGTFEFAALPAPPYVVQVDHADYSPSDELAVVSTSKPLIVRLEAGADLSGEVVAADDDEPIVGARLSIHTGNSTRNARTARDGTFEFRHLPLGDYSLFIEADRFVSDSHSGRLEASAAGPSHARIALVREGGVAGEVVDRFGATVWNAEVTSGSPPEWERAVRTDHAGHFELGGLAAGDHVLSVRYTGPVVTLPSPVRVYAGQQSQGVVVRLAEVADSSPEQAAAPRRESKPAAGLSLVLRDGSVIIDRLGSAGSSSGIEAGDVLLSIDGEPVRSAAHARGMLSNTRGDSTRLLEVLRAGKLTRLRYASGR